MRKGWHFAVTRNRWCRILGVSFIMFVDRTNIAMAIPGIRADLGLTASEIGFATGMFFWGYLVLPVPVGRISAVWSAKWVILGLIVLWSGVSVTTAFVHSNWPRFPTSPEWLSCSSSQAAPIGVGSENGI
jgi:MFS family permease